MPQWCERASDRRTRLGAGIRIVVLWTYSKHLLMCTPLTTTPNQTTHLHTKRLGSIRPYLVAARILVFKLCFAPSLLRKVAKMCAVPERVSETKTKGT